MSVCPFTPTNHPSKNGLQNPKRSRLKCLFLRLFCDRVQYTSCSISYKTATKSCVKERIIPPQIQKRLLIDPEQNLIKSITIKWNFAVTIHILQLQSSSVVLEICLCYMCQIPCAAENLQLHLNSIMNLNSGHLKNKNENTLKNCSPHLPLLYVSYLSIETYETKPSSFYKKPGKN